MLEMLAGRGGGGRRVEVGGIPGGRDGVVGVGGFGGMKGMRFEMEMQVKVKMWVEMGMGGGGRRVEVRCAPLARAVVV